MKVYTLIELPKYASNGEYQSRLILEGHKPGILDGTGDRRRHCMTDRKASRERLFRRLETYGITTGTTKDGKGRMFTAWMFEGKPARLELER